MKQKRYLTLTAILFGIIAVLHLLRILNDWPVEIDSIVVPLWISWIAFFLSAFLSYTAYSLEPRKK